MLNALIQPRFEAIHEASNLDSDPGGGQDGSWRLPPSREGDKRSHALPRRLPVNEPLPQIASGNLRRLFAYWDRLRAGRIGPSWAEIDPAEIKALLPHIIVAEFQWNPFDIRFRLVGTMIVEAYGEDFMGRNLRNVEPTGGVDLWLGLYARLAKERLPLYGRYSLSSDYVQTQYVDAGIFPLSADGMKVDKAIELEDWSQAAALAPSVLMHPAWRFDPL